MRYFYNGERYLIAGNSTYLIGDSTLNRVELSMRDKFVLIGNSIRPTYLILVSYNTCILFSAVYEYTVYSMQCIVPCP